MKILKEHMLASDFKIGFELEGFWDFLDKKKEIEEEIKTEFDYYERFEELKNQLKSNEINKKEFETLFDELKYSITDEINTYMENEIERFENEIRKYWKGGDFGDDTSIEVMNETLQFRFEYNSPPFDLTPANLSKLVEFLDRLPEWNIGVNESCGFHVHFSAKNINFNDIKWFIFQFALDENPENFHKIVDFSDEIKFINDKYAGIKFYERMQVIVDNTENREDVLNSLKEFVVKMNEEKYVLFNAHSEYETLEWRGVRDFLNIHDKENIYKFIRKIYQFIQIFNKLISKKTLTHFNITKQELFSENIDKGLISSFLGEYRKLLMKLYDNEGVIYKFNSVKKLLDKNYPDINIIREVLPIIISDNYEHFKPIFIKFLSAKFSDIFKEEKILNVNSMGILVEIIEKFPEVEDDCINLIAGFNFGYYTDEAFENTPEILFVKYYNFLQKYRNDERIKEYYEHIRAGLFQDYSLDKIYKELELFKPLSEEDFENEIIVRGIMKSDDWEEYIEFGVENELVKVKEFSDIIFNNLEELDLYRIKELIDMGSVIDEDSDLFYEKLFKQIKNGIYLEEIYDALDKERLIEMTNSYFNHPFLGDNDKIFIFIHFMNFLEDLKYKKLLIKNFKPCFEKSLDYNKRVFIKIIVSMNYLSLTDLELVMRSLYGLKYKSILETAIRGIKETYNNKEYVEDLYNKIYGEEISYSEWKKITGHRF